MSESEISNNLEDLDGLGDLIGQKDDLSEDLQSDLAEILALESELDAKEEELKLYPGFEIEISPNEMEIYLVVPEGSPPPTLDAVMQKVVSYQFGCTITLEAIEMACLPTAGTAGVRALIGEGSVPVDGKDGYLEFYVEDPTENLITNATEDSVDYRSHSRIVDVEKDQELATIHPPTEPIHGTDVFGNKSLAQPGQAVTLKPGKNTYFVKENHTIYAAKKGCLIFEDESLSVEELFIVDGNLDMKIGNVDTENRILVRGDVREGYSVRSTKDIHIQGNVEGSSITSSNGSIVIEGGFIGKGVATLRAKKSLSCRFAIHGILCSEGDIFIDDSIMHTTITCGRTLDVSKGKHGLICGGHIRIQDKIYAKKIGSKSETRTDCFMGFDYSYEEKLHSMDLQAQELLHQIFQLDETIAETVQELQKMNQSTNDYQEAMRLQLGRKKERLLQKVKLDELNKSIRQIESMAFSDTKSEVKIINETYPNTVFHVYRKSHKIEEETQGFEAIMEAVNGIIEVLE